MECKKIQPLLFMYSKGAIQSGEYQLVEEHIKTCKECADLVIALKQLIPALTFGYEDEKTHFLITFPMQKVSYSGVGTHFKYAKEMNQRLEELGGKIPDNEV